MELFLRAFIFQVCESTDGRSNRQDKIPHVCVCVKVFAIVWMTCRQDCDALKITNERKRQCNRNRSSQQVAANEDSNPRQVGY